MRVHRCFERATFNAAIALPNANLPESEWDHIRFEALMKAAEQLDPHAHHVGMVMAYSRTIPAARARVLLRNGASILTTSTTRKSSIQSFLIPAIPNPRARM